MKSWDLFIYIIMAGIVLTIVGGIYISLSAYIAQLVEQRTFNPWVQGSSPCRGTLAYTQTAHD